MNKAVLVGHLSRDVEIGTTGSGKNYARFSLAVNRRFKNADGEYEADFINCIAWEKTADVLNKYTHKGSKIGVVGRIQTRSYEVDGSKRIATEIMAEEVELLDSKEQSSGGTERKKTALKDMDPLDDSDLPF